MKIWLAFWSGFGCCALCVLLMILLAGCAPPQAPKQVIDPAKQHKPTENRVKVRPDTDYRSKSAWWYCDIDSIDPAYIVLSRAPIVDGQVMAPREEEVVLDWLANCEDVAKRLDDEISGRERW